MKALITGITGQDGSYLAELLLEKGYQVHGMVRRSSEEKFERINHLRDRITLHQGDLLDQFSLAALLSQIQPDEVYNLAAQSFVPTSWSQPVLTGEFTALGVTKMLEASATPFRRRASTKPPRPRCSAKCWRRRRRRRPRSTPALRMAWPKRTGTTSPSTTASPSGCTRSAASSSTTSRLGAAWSSSPGRSPSARRK